MHQDERPDLRRREQWAHRRGHHEYLWPDVPTADWRAGLREIERVTRAALHAPVPEDETASAIELRAPCGVRALGIAAFTSGMGPLLGWWSEEGRVRTEPAVDAVLRQHLEHCRRRAARMRDATRDVIEHLGEAGIRPVLVKSAHTASSYFPEPGVRPAADIDLVLESAAMATAEHVLGGRGYRLIKRKRRPWKSDWLPPGAPTVLQSLDFSHADSPYTVELHAGLDREFFGVRTVRLEIRADDIRAAPRPFVPAAVLKQPLLAAYLALHASEELHQLQLIRIVELVEVLRTDTATGSLDWAALAERLEAVGGARFAFPAFELADQLVPGAVDPVLLDRLRAAAPPRMRRVLARIGPGTAQGLDGVSLDERFMWASGPVELARRCWRLLVPPEAGPRAIARAWSARALRLLRGRVRLRRGADGA